VRHDLSDVRLTEALDDRAGFRRSCGFAAREPAPGRTAFVRFRRELARRGLDGVLFEAVKRQPEAKGAMARAGTPVDAARDASASIRNDGGPTRAPGCRAGHRRCKPAHGCEAHAATNGGAGLVRGVGVTTANAHDAELEAALPREAAGNVHADSAYARQRSAACPTSFEAADVDPRRPGRAWAPGPTRRNVPDRCGVVGRGGVPARPGGLWPAAPPPDDARPARHRAPRARDRLRPAAPTAGLPAPADDAALVPAPCPERRLRARGP
jgi:IS5 family transposase